jgi:hypothetical protein
MDAMGGDVERVRVVKEAVAFDEAGLANVDAFIAEHRPLLVVIDPLFAYVGAKADVYRPNEMRAVTARLSALAERHGCAILALRHLTKADMGAAILRGLGSIDLAAAARSILLAGEDPNVPGRRAIVHIKSNLAPKGNAQGYRVLPGPDPKGPGRFEWTGRSTLTANTILSAPQRSAAERAPSLHEAKEFLQRELANGQPRPARELYAEAARVGISGYALRQAAKALGVKKEKVGFRGITYWSLPPKMSETLVHRNIGIFDQSEGQQPHEQAISPKLLIVNNLEVHTPMVNHATKLGAVVTGVTPMDEAPQGPPKMSMVNIFENTAS